MSGDGDDDYVGYRRPPRATRFQKGRSGNPGGRPRGRTTDMPYEGILGRMVTVRDGGREIRMTAAEAFLLYTAKRGMAGDVAAANDILAALDAVRLRGHPHDTGISEIICICISPGNPNSAMLCLGMARKLDRYQDSAFVMLEPWLVQTALDRLGTKRLSEQEQRMVLNATYQPHKVKWPLWWVVRA